MRAKRSVFNAFSGLFSQFVSVALGVIIPRLVLVQLGSEANGLLSATQQALVYLDLLESGIGTAALQALYKPAAEQDRAAVSGIFNAIRREYAKVGIAYAALVCGLSVLFPFFIKTELPFFTVLLTVLLGGMGQAVRFLFQAKYRVLLQAEGRGYVLINANLLLTVSISIGKIILLICGLSLIAVQLLCFLCGLLQTALLTLYAKKQYSWLDRAVPPDTTATAQHRAVLVHQISGLIFQNTDVLLLSVVCGLKTTSVYSMYVMLFGMVGTAVSAINGSVSFVLGQTYHTDRAHFLRLYRAFETYNMALTFALYLTADVFILPFLKLYTAGVTDISYLDPVLPHLFVCTYLLSNGRAAAQRVIEYAGHFQKTQNRSVIESVINLLISLLLVVPLGMYGVLIGTIAALLYRTNDMIFYASHKLLHVPARRTYRKFLCSGTLFVLLWFSAKALPLPLNSYPALLLSAAVFCIFSLLLFTVLGSALDCDARRVLFAIWCRTAMTVLQKSQYIRRKIGEKRIFTHRSAL